MAAAKTTKAAPAAETKKVKTSSIIKSSLKDGVLTLSFKINEAPLPLSVSGKSNLVFTSKGTQVLEASVEGKNIHMMLTAYIPVDKED